MGTGWVATDVLNNEEAKLDSSLLEDRFRIDPDGGYLSVWVPGFIKTVADHWALGLHELEKPIKWHLDAVTQILLSPSGNTGDFQQIVFTNHLDIAHGLSSAHVLVSCGFLADALTVLRPAVEHMIDIQYLKRWPREVAQYHSTFVEAYERSKEEDYIPEFRDFARPWRFKNISTVINHLSKQTDCSELEKVLAAQWKWLSNVAEHSSPMRKWINGKRDNEWGHVIEQIGYVASLACEQIYTSEVGLKATIDNDTALANGYKTLISSGVVRRPEEQDEAG